MATVQLQLAVFRTVLCFDKHVLLFHLLERIVSLCHLHSVIKDSDHAQKTVAHNPPGSNSSHWMDHSRMIYSFHVYASQNQPWIKLYPWFKIIAKYFKKWTTWNRDTPPKKSLNFDTVQHALKSMTALFLSKKTTTDCNQHWVWNHLKSWDSVPVPGNQNQNSEDWQDFSSIYQWLKVEKTRTYSKLVKPLRRLYFIILHWLKALKILIKCDIFRKSQF